MLNDSYAVKDVNGLNADTYKTYGLAQSVKRPFNKTRGRRFKPRWFFLLFFFLLLLLLSFKIIAKLIIKCSLLETIYLPRMKSCLWGWSFYRYSLAKDPFLIGYICFLATLSMMQVRHLRTQLINIQLRNRFRVHMVYECAWGSIPGECATYRSL